VYFACGLQVIEDLKKGIDTITKTLSVPQTMYAVNIGIILAVCGVLELNRKVG
jgi:hypothetical protein